MPNSHIFKYFLWRAGSGSLSVNAELHRRHIRQDSGCGLCGCDQETIPHVLYECTAASHIWNDSSFSDLLRDISNLSFNEGFKLATTRLSKGELSSFATLLWASWTSRNKAMYDTVPHDPKYLARGFIRYVQGYNVYASKVFGNKGQSMVGSATSWICPPEGIMKINVDAAVINGAEVGLGVVVRDSHGKLIATAVRRRLGAWDPGIAEAAAACYGMEIAMRFGYTKVWLEGDSLGVIQKIRNKQEGFNYQFLFLDKIRNAIALLNQFSCSHVKRGGNTLAHFIARLCPPDVMEQVSFEPFPQGVLNLAELDFA